MAFCRVEAVTWRPPENSVVRINFDAFLLFSQQKTLACIQSLMFGLDLGLLEAEIEGDALIVSFNMLGDQQIEFLTYWPLKA